MILPPPRFEKHSRNISRETFSLCKPKHIRPEDRKGMNIFRKQEESLLYQLSAPSPALLGTSTNPEAYA